jgi:hypothetical protein
MNLRWERVLHRSQERIADVPNLGRYHIKRAVRARTWIIRLNGQVIGQAFSAEEAVGFAERHSCKELSEV